MLISIFEKSSPASFIAYQTRSLTAPLQHMGQAAWYNPMRRFRGKSCALHRVAMVLHTARGKTGVYPTGSTGTAVWEYCVQMLQWFMHGADVTRMGSNTPSSWRRLTWFKCSRVTPLPRESRPRTVTHLTVRKGFRACKPYKAFYTIFSTFLTLSKQSDFWQVSQTFRNKAVALSAQANTYIQNSPF